MAQKMRALQCLLASLLWVEASSFGLFASPSGFLGRSIAGRAALDKIASQSLTQSRLGRMAEQKLFQRLQDGGLASLSCRSSTTQPKKEGAIRTWGRGLRERLRRYAAFGTDVILHPLKERIFRKWSKKFILYRGTDEERAIWEGKTALVTGGSGGIGMQAAAGLASRGFNVIIACRDADKGKGACDEIRSMVPDAKVEAMSLDLSSLDSVRALGRDFNAAWGDRNSPRPLDVLVNNAGYGGGGPGGLTMDSLEWYFQVNHLGHFLLSHLLFPNLVASQHGGRIVSVSSVMHWGADKTLVSDTVERGEALTRPTGGGGEYRRSKLYNLLFTFSIARKFVFGKGGVSAHAVNPGFVYSDIWRHEKSERLKRVYQAYCKTTQQGAEGIIRAASEAVYGNSSGFFLVDALPAGSSELSKNEEVAEWLWGVSEGLAGVWSFGEPEAVVNAAEEIEEEDGLGLGEVVEVGADALSELTWEELSADLLDEEGARPDPEMLEREAQAVREMEEITAVTAAKLAEIASKASKRLGL